MNEFDRVQALTYDENDDLKDFRQRFYLPDSNLVYLDGNSLGLMPAKTPLHLQHVLEYEWGQRQIRSWNEGWYNRPSEIASKIAHLIGAQEDEVVVADGTSVNLFKLAWAALRYRAEKKTIVSDELNFPSDIYIFQGLQDAFGGQHNLRLAKSADGITVSMEELERCMGSDCALLSLSHVLFKSAFMYDMKAVTRLAHQKGAMVLWDLSHATGAVSVDLNACQADLAVGCTYKYLNGGPGAPAFLYVRKDLQEKLFSPVQGWFGQHKPFDFSLQYDAAPGIKRFMAGTPPVLSLSALDTSLDILGEAGMDRIREKSLRQTRYLIELFEKYLKNLGFELGSPDQDRFRGSHVAMRHPEAYRICQALIDPAVGTKTVIPDFRDPDVIRIGIAPLYNTFEEILDSVVQMELIVANQLYEKFPVQRNAVT
mgnify:CR=1 FL=1